MRYDNRFFQFEPQSRGYAPAQSKVLVCEGRHGSMAVEYRGRALRWQEIPAPARPSELEAATKPGPPRTKQKWVPSAQHWRQAVRRAVQKRTSKLAAVAMRPSLTLPSVSP